MDMNEHVARKLCRAAFPGPECPVCEKYFEPCSMWYTFLDEAQAAISGVRDYNLLTPRKKPRL